MGDMGDRTRKTGWRTPTPAEYVGSVKRLKRLYDDAWTIRELSGEVGLSYGAVRRRLEIGRTEFRGRGGGPSTRPPSILPGYVESGYREGASLRELAERADLSRVEVRRRMIRRGIEPRAYAPLEDTVPRTIIDAYDSGFSIEGMADHWLTPEHEIRRVLRDHGVRWPTVGGVRIDEGEVRRRYGGGASLRELANDFRVEEDDLRHWMSAHAGIAWRAGMPLDEADRFEVAEALYAGADFGGLADDYLVPGGVLSEWLG